jgi:hypothetical protein
MFQQTEKYLYSWMNIFAIHHILLFLSKEYFD